MAIDRIGSIGSGITPEFKGPKKPKSSLLQKITAFIKKIFASKTEKKHGSLFFSQPKKQSSQTKKTDQIATKVFLGEERFLTETTLSELLEDLTSLLNTRSTPTSLADEDSKEISEQNALKNSLLKEIKETLRLEFEELSSQEEIFLALKIKQSVDQKRRNNPSIQKELEQCIKKIDHFIEQKLEENTLILKEPIVLNHLEIRDGQIIKKEKEALLQSAYEIEDHIAYEAIIDGESTSGDIVEKEELVIFQKEINGEIFEGEIIDGKIKNNTIIHTTDIDDAFTQIEDTELYVDFINNFNQGLFSCNIEEDGSSTSIVKFIKTLKNNGLTKEQLKKLSTIAHQGLETTILERLRDTEDLILLNSDRADLKKQIHIEIQDNGKISIFTKFYFESIDPKTTQISLLEVSGYIEDILEENPLLHLINEDSNYLDLSLEESLVKEASSVFIEDVASPEKTQKDLVLEKLTRPLVLEKLAYLPSVEIPTELQKELSKQIDLFNQIASICSLTFCPLEKLSIFIENLEKEVESLKKTVKELDINYPSHVELNSTLKQKQEILKKILAHAQVLYLFHQGSLEEKYTTSKTTEKNYEIFEFEGPEFEGFGQIKLLRTFVRDLERHHLRLKGSSEPISLQEFIKKCLKHNLTKKEITTLSSFCHQGVAADPLMKYAYADLIAATGSFIIEVDLESSEGVSIKIETSNQLFKSMEDIEEPCFGEIKTTTHLSLNNPREITSQTAFTPN